MSFSPLWRALAATLLSAAALASETVSSPQLDKLFRQAGVSGTFVLYDVGADRYTVHDASRASQRFLPASTFKIPNSLIGLSTGAVKSVDEVFPYDGQPRTITLNGEVIRMSKWEKDMGLREAIQVSNVKVYQSLARRIGLEKMHAAVQTLGYGNADIGTEVDRFWLDGPLAISAIEQTDFLAKLAQGTLPFPSEAQAAVRDITTLEKQPHYTLHGKTGWGERPGQSDIGWWVGWVERDGHFYSFALNIDVPDNEAGAKRVPLGRACLDALKLI